MPNALHTSDDIYVHMYVKYKIKKFNIDQNQVEKLK